MTASNGFVDLRLNRQEGQNQDSFWPSFTDIMTVIVMIFMIAMVILLLRNIELVRQLRATVEAERNAMELARSTGEEKESLALKLIAAENELSMLRMRQMRLDEESGEQKARIGSQSDRIARLQLENELITITRDQLAAEKRTLTQRLSRSETRAASLQQNQDELKQDLESTSQELSSLGQELDSLHELQAGTQQQLAALHEKFGRQAQELQEAQRSGRLSDRKLSSLQGEFDHLEVKYNELFRPARSPEGRYLAEVRYSKSGGRHLIEFATGEQPGFHPISRSELDRRLEQLKQSKQNGLYIKVIFPADSGLSYSEAWGFTSDLHARYDYYSQQPPSDPVAPQGTE